MPKREVENIDELKTLVGQEVAAGDWFEIAQERINRFADATEDHQWIHVDVERARRESPFGVPIAHGYLTLSLIPFLFHEAFRIRQKFKMGINYGTNRVRFMSPAPAGCRIRNRVKLLELGEIQGGWQAVWQMTIEVEGRDKPACVAEVVYRMYQ